VTPPTGPGRGGAALTPEPDRGHTWRVPLSGPVTLAILAALAAAAVVAVLRWRAERRAGSGLTPGFKGWLLLFLAVLWLSVPRLLAGIVDLLAEIEGEPDGGGLALFDVAHAGVTLALVAITAALPARRARVFPHVQAALLAWTALYIPTVLVLLVTVSPSTFTPPLDPAQALASLSGAEVGSWAIRSAAALAWLVYARRSRRVAITCTF